MAVLKYAVYGTELPYTVPCMKCTRIFISFVIQPGYMHGVVYGMHVFLAVML